MYKTDMLPAAHIFGHPIISDNRSQGNVCILKTLLTKQSHHVHEQPVSSRGQLQLHVTPIRQRWKTCKFFKCT